MKNTTIYALVDPRNNEVRYIGKSDRPEERYKHHCRGTDKTHNANWVKSMHPVKPKMVVVEVVKSGWVEAEQFWISYFKFLGAKLTNLTAGGEGCIGYRPTLESIAKMRIAHSNMSAETRARIGEANRNRSPESIAKMAATKRGTKASSETRAKMSAAHKGQKRSLDARANMVAGRRNMSDEAKSDMGAKISAALKGKKFPEERVSNMRGRKRSPETIEKMRSAGFNISDETRAKKSIAAKAYQERKRSGQLPASLLR